LVDPSSEGFSNDRVDYINHILARHFANLSEDGQALDDLSFGEAVVKDTIERKALVLGHKQKFDIVTEDRLLGSCSYVL
jgi:hypothetical protein